MRLVCRDWTSRSQDRSYTVPNLEFYECPDCGEKVYDREAMKKIESYSPAFVKPSSGKQGSTRSKRKAA